MTSRECWIFDIDGTISDSAHRRHFLERTPKDWAGFFEAQDRDPPVQHMHMLVRLITLSGGQVVYVTGRPDDTRAATEAWLRRNGFLTCTTALSLPWLYMRAAGDRRDDTIVKVELLSRLRGDGWRPIMAFEDRARVVEMWRSNGVPCAQIAEGNF